MQYSSNALDPYLNDIEALRESLTLTFTEENLNDLCKLARNIAETKPLILTAGNGGSHAAAEHLTGELVWRLSAASFISLPSVCLSSNSTVLTAVSNDDSYESSLAQQLNAFRNIESKIYVSVFTTSGRSKNLVQLLNYSKEIPHISTIAFVGQGSGDIKADETFKVHGLGRLSGIVIQQIHLAYIHFLCQMISEKLYA